MARVDRIIMDRFSRVWVMKTVPGRFSSVNELMKRMMKERKWRQKIDFVIAADETSVAICWIDIMRAHVVKTNFQLEELMVAPREDFFKIISRNRHCSWHLLPRHWITRERSPDHLQEAFVRAWESLDPPKGYLAEHLLDGPGLEYANRD